MQDRLTQRDITYLLHFTKYSNLPSIMANGLLRRTELDRRDLAYDFNDDLRLDGHPNSLSVSIGFPNYRMFYSARQRYTEDTWIVLVLSTDILIHKACAYYARNAASGCYKHVPPANLQSPEAFEAMFADIEGKQRAILGISDDYTTDPQAEVLVFADIEPRYIEQVATQNKAQEQQIRQAYPDFGDGNVKHFPPLFDARQDYEHWK